jgi:two-component system chemotaxis response regulator CheB
VAIQAPQLLRVFHGPKENRARPAVNPLFRSAATHFGPRVIGIVLSGALDDGTTGLGDIKQCKGLAVVQSDAITSSMPDSALRHVEVDHCVPIAEMGELLLSLVEAEIPDEEWAPTERMLMETESALNGGLSPEKMDKIGVRQAMICPECGGPFWKIEVGSALLFRCHIGHSYNGDSLSLEQKSEVERSLGNAVRNMGELGSLAEKLAAVAEAAGDKLTAEAQRLVARQSADDVEVIRTLILKNRDRVTT